MLHNIYCVQVLVNHGHVKKEMLVGKVEKLERFQEGAELLTLGEVAAILRSSEHTLRRWMRDGEGPPAFKVGATWRFDHAALQGWIQ